MKNISWILLFTTTFTTTLVKPAWTQTESATDELSADIIELQTVTCREILKSEYEDRADTIIFMHGYLSGKKDETTLNAPILAEATDRILETCIDDPERTLLSVFEESRQ